MAKAIHTMIRVLDETRSIEFYRTAFGLEVAERRRADQRVRVRVVRTVRGHQGIAHPRAENLLRICHGSSLVLAVALLGINIPVPGVPVR